MRVEQKKEKFQPVIVTLESPRDVTTVAMALRVALADKSYPLWDSVDTSTARSLSVRLEQCV